MDRYEIYTRPGCIYCEKAKRLLKNNHIYFQEYDVYSHPLFMEQMKSRTGNRMYPQIFIDDVGIGGYDDLVYLFESNQLTFSNLYGSENVSQNKQQYLF